MTSTTETKKVLDAQEISLLAKEMETKYQGGLQGRKFTLKNTKQQSWVFVTVTLSNADESFFYPVEAKVNWEQEELEPAEASMFLFDYIDLYFEEYFTESDETVYLPIDWTAHQYDAVDFLIKGQILNLKVERLGDDILRACEESEIEF